MSNNIAPPRIWIGLEQGRVYSGPLKNTVEYLAAVPIREALEACEVKSVLLGPYRSMVLDQKSWDALVESVKGV